MRTSPTTNFPTQTGINPTTTDIFTRVPSRPRSYTQQASKAPPVSTFQNRSQATSFAAQQTMKVSASTGFPRDPGIRQPISFQTTISSQTTVNPQQAQLPALPAMRTSATTTNFRLPPVPQAMKPSVASATATEQSLPRSDTQQTIKSVVVNTIAAEQSLPRSNTQQTMRPNASTATFTRNPSIYRPVIPMPRASSSQAPSSDGIQRPSTLLSPGFMQAITDTDEVATSPRTPMLPTKPQFTASTHSPATVNGRQFPGESPATSSARQLPAAATGSERSPQTKAKRARANTML
jgi:hypothetical protein